MTGSSDDDLDLRLPNGKRVRAGDLTWRATTSGGPGGQHANRTASRVEVSVSIAALPLEPREQALLYERLAARITGAGDISVAADDHRSQHRNRRIALRRLERVIADALKVHKPRIRTNKGMGAKLRARAAKQQHAQRKRGRRSDWTDED